ncbi:12395_t:CDS:2 [Entrophospora sp. SA101]|nr:138_t:CDS:2 [Entrophospora sp. SA101]CAJ0747746.1 12395_t:CDS:2 [Entrophospora sp. SA101]
MSVLQVVLELIIPRPVITDPTATRLRDSQLTAQVIRKFETNYGDVHPDFFQGSFSQAFDQAKNDVHFLMVILETDEHDNTDKFNRITLQATTYPFIAFIVLQPPNGSSGSSQKMTVVDRIEGFTTTENIVTRLTNQVNRHEMSLRRMRNERAEREAARQIRDQQDMAYQASLLADQEKERKAHELAEAKRLAEENAKKEKIQRKLTEEKKLKWRRWALSALPDEPPESDKNVARLSFRLANGERVVRRFKPDDTVEMMYVFVDTYFLREDHSSSSSNLQFPPDDYTHKFDFLLISPYPRTEYHVDKCKTIKNENDIWPSANLIVESLTNGDDNDNADDN